MNGHYRTWMEINLSQIEKNYREIAARLPAGCRMMAVVKANAYGVDAVPVALAAEKAGCDYFAVTFLEEALRLREAGVRAKILVMAPIAPEDADAAAEAGVTITLCDMEGAGELAARAAASGLCLEAHVKLDTGLSRLGLLTAGREEQTAAEVEELIALPQFRVTGIYTHITDASIVGGDALNRRELARFKTVSDLVAAKGHRLLRHCLSTGPLVEYPEFAYDYVRIGSMLYGAYGSLGVYGDYQVENSIGLYSRVMQVKEIPCGSSISYGPLFTTLRDTRIAVVPIGFADGLRRALSNTGRMIVNGHWAPIVGKICCDHTILDVTDIPDVKRGDLVTIFGREGDLEQVPGNFARLVGATASEITAVFNARIPRISVEG